MLFTSVRCFCIWFCFEMTGFLIVNLYLFLLRLNPLAWNTFNEELLGDIVFVWRQRFIYITIFPWAFNRVNEITFIRTEDKSRHDEMYLSRNSFYQIKQDTIWEHRSNHELILLFTKSKISGSNVGWILFLKFV